MKKKTLYISDLDGTLLSPEMELTPNTVNIINTFIDQGGLFTIATARGLDSVIPLISGLHLQLPLILHNGVSIFDISLRKYLKQTYISQDLTRNMIQYIQIQGHHPILYGSNAEGKNRVYFTELQNAAEENYIGDRLQRGDQRFQCVKILPVETTEVIGIKIILPHVPANLLCTQLNSKYKAQIHVMEDIYTPGFSWVEISDLEGTKRAAVQYMRGFLEVDWIVCFGDQINDISMFEVADEGFAMSNAVDALKQIATRVIGPNTEDSVAQFLNQLE